MTVLPADARIGEVTLAVSDIERSTAFYTGVLGFAVLERENGRATLAAAAAGRPLLRLVAEPGARPKPRRTAGLFHVAILVPSRADLGRSLRQLAARQWPLSGAADHLVSEALYLNDPDGLGLEIYRDRPRAGWRVDHGETLMATDPLSLDDVACEPGAEVPWTGLAAGTAIGHVHLQVPDLAAAEAFYCGDLGFAPTLRRYPGALFVAAGSYHHHLGLNVWAGHGVPPPPPDAVGLRRFTIEASSVPAREVADPMTGVAIAVTSAA